MCVTVCVEDFDWGALQSKESGQRDALAERVCMKGHKGLLMSALTLFCLFLC